MGEDNEAKDAHETDELHVSGLNEAVTAGADEGEGEEGDNARDGEADNEDMQKEEDEDGQNEPNGEFEQGQEQGQEHEQEDDKEPDDIQVAWELLEVFLSLLSSALIFMGLQVARKIYEGNPGPDTDAHLVEVINAPDLNGV